MSRWKVQNINYDWVGYDQARLKKFTDVEEPWEVSCLTSGCHYRTFATHAEALGYVTTYGQETQ